MAGPISNDTNGINNPYALRRERDVSARGEGRAEASEQATGGAGGSSSADRVSLSAEARALSAGNGPGEAQTLASKVGRQIAGDGATAMRAQAGGASADLLNLLRAPA